MKRVIRYYNKKAILLTKQIEEEFYKRYKKADIFSAIIFAPLSDDELGLFDCETKAVYLNDILLKEDYSFDIVLNIALHELSHAISFALYGYASHDSVFRSICKIVGVNPSFDKAKVNISQRKVKEQKLEKIKKLISLSTSPSSFEGQAAMKKAQELMEAYGIKEIEEREIDEVYEICFKEAKRYSQTDYTLLAMTQDLTGIFTIRTTDGLKGYGSFDGIESAIYIYDTLESIIDEEIKKLKLRKQIEINSFYRGVLATLSKENDKSNMMVVYSENARLAKELVFSSYRFGKRYSRFHSDNASYNGGKSFGKEIKIDKNKIKKTKLLT